jgi:hypothetical protein
MMSLEKEKSILEQLLKRTIEWEPEEGASLEMPKISVDNKQMPRSQQARIQKFKEMIKECEANKLKLGEKSPFQPKSSTWKALKDIWNQK